MERINDGMKRGCIYFFYDGQGVVDDYVTYLLSDLTKNIDELVIVCNGVLGEAGRQKFEQYDCEIIVRPNEGLDVGAYKAGLDYWGWERLKTFDELVMLNHTIMGPVYPFSETFSKMKERDIDFWGITKHERAEDPFGLNPYGYLPEHIQSHFMVFRKSLINSEDFRRYWDGLRKITNYRESVCYHESYFTKCFSDLGYKWEVSVPVEDMKNMSDYPIFYCAREMVEEKRCPIFKRRAFFHDYGQLLETTAGQPVLELYNFLETSKLYDTEMIWKNILRTMDHSEIAKNLHLDYTLSSEICTYPLPSDFYKKRKIALMIHIYYVDELENMKAYIRNIPEQADVFVTTQTEEKKKKIEEFFSIFPNKVTVKLVQNRGRDVSAFMMSGRDVLDKYDYICFIHDKKVTQEKPGTVGTGFAYICYKNVLESRAYVENILSLFERKPHLGVLCPPKPLHGPYVLGLMQDWEMNFSNTEQLLRDLGIKVPIDQYKLPIAPHGSCFWFRSSAVRKLFEHNWQYEDFPEEPLPIDGTISHAIERSYAYVAQDAGYYTGIVMSDQYARVEYTTLMHYASTFGTQRLMGMFGSPNFHGWDYKIKYFLRRILPRTLFVNVINFKRKLLGPHVFYKYEDN